MGRIGLDLMGSERAPNEYFDAVNHLQQKLGPAHSLEIIATPDFLPHPSLKCHTVSEVITMEDDPLTAVRRKRNSSLVTGIQMLKSGELDALISAGNTGALIASCALELTSLPKITRPALLASLFLKDHTLAVIDVGGNVSYKAENLVQFARMGTAFQRATQNISRPTVGLLNIGTEAIKGTGELRKAHRLLQDTHQKEHFHFAGNVEGHEVFQGNIDVLITDGFTGNIFLKTAEGLTNYLIEDIIAHSHHNISPQVATQLQEYCSRYHYAEYPGAIVCGIEGLVMKCHGASSPEAIVNSIKSAISFTQQNLLGKMKEELQACSSE